MDYILNIFFILFHTVFALFNLSGWYWKKTRRLNLYTLLLTAFSWLILGIWYGIGYCPFTEWHWQVRYRLGYIELPVSYIKFLLDMFTGLNFNPLYVDIFTGIAFALALLISFYMNLRDFLTVKKTTKNI